MNRMPEPDQRNDAPNPDGTALHIFRADRATYWRDHAWMAAIAMAAGMAILWFMDNPHLWTGAVGGLAAIGIRGWYLASEELGHEWVLTATRLTGPGERNIRLADITKFNGILSAVQIVTRTGDKHLMKYQGNKAETISRLQAAQQGAST